MDMSIHNKIDNAHSCLELLCCFTVLLLLSPAAFYILLKEFASPSALRTVTF